MQVFPRINTLTLILSAWAWELCGIFVLLALYRIEDKHDVLAFLSHRDGKLFLGAATLLACTSVVVIWSYIHLSKGEKQPLRSFLKWNILPLIFIITIVETSFRVFSTDTPSGPMLGDRLLGPGRLDVAVPLFSQGSNELLYYDQLLGWTVRPNLSSSDGLYFTSFEGIRDSSAGSMFAALPGTCRIALVGDSHTFGLELKFEDTWGNHLEDFLPKGCKVLNFGVGGYSLGQMYLRFMRDIRPWHPTVVILALSSHSTARTMGVYGINMFEQVLPWAQPRFQFQNRELKVMNVPLPSLEAIMAARSMSALPNIEYDWFFSPGKWELPRWRYMYKSYLFRSYVTWFPLWRRQYNGDSAEAINHSLLSAFVRAAKAEGFTPVVLYLPDEADYKDMIRQETPSLSILRTSGIDYVDLRACLDQVNSHDRFIPHGSHYSQNGSIAIARCVFDRLPSVKYKTRSS
jgi:hypothetical protein